MSSPRWTVLVIALLLGVATGDCLVQTPTEAQRAEVNVLIPPQQTNELWEAIANGP